MNLAGLPRRRVAAPAGGRSRSAFTLVEIMIALTILMTAIAAAYASWAAVVRASKAGLDAAVRVQRTRMTIRTLVDALLSVEMYGGNADLYAFYADTSGDYAYASWVSRLPASFPDAGLFGDQVVRRVTFSVEPGAQGNQLVMYQMPLLAVETQDQKPFPVVLARDVSLFALEFWDGRANKWLDAWDNTNALPKMVRVSIGVGRSRRLSEPEESFTRIVSLPAMVVPEASQLGGPGGPPTGRQPGRPSAGGNPDPAALPIGDGFDFGARPIFPGRGGF